LWLRISLRLGSGWMRESHARQLEIMTEAVAIAKLPPDEQRDKLEELNARVRAEAQTPQGTHQILAGLALGALVKIADACARSRAQLRCAIAALALERYRLAHNRWPGSLEKLVPEFLHQVPLDPYDRKPLRYQRLDDGVAIYSVGPDGVDNGGKLDRKNFVAPGTDMVFRLWNVDRRRQPPPPQEPPKVVPDDRR
jgi:type II secretory pathway pseudopilin PulG